MSIKNHEYHEYHEYPAYLAFRLPGFLVTQSAIYALVGIAEYNTRYNDCNGRNDRNNPEESRSNA